MTISTQDNRANYVGDGIITQFSFGFRTLDDAHIFPYLDAVVQGSGFTVTRNADQDSLCRLVSVRANDRSSVLLDGLK